MKYMDLLRLSTLTVAIALVGCGGGGSSDESSAESDTSSATLSAFNLVSLESANTSNDDGSGDVKMMTLNWDEASESTGITYRVCELDDTQVNSCLEHATVIDQLSATIEVESLVDAISASYFIIADNGTETKFSSEVTIEADQLNQMIGYFKLNTESSYSGFGGAVALNTDGTVMAVGASGIDDGGAVYIFRSESGTWSQSEEVKPLVIESGDNFGTSLSLSSDGNTLVVGAQGEDSDADTVNGDSSNNDAYYAGAAYVFEYEDGAWSQTAYLKAPNSDYSDDFGESVAISGDGLTVVVGAADEDSNATGIDGDGDNNDAIWSGAAYVFSNENSIWSFSAYLKADDATEKDYFGTTVAINSDGSLIAVGAPSALSSGVTYIFSYDGSQWNQDDSLQGTSDTIGSGASFGEAVSLSSDGITLTVGAPSEDDAYGGVYIFINDGTDWNQTAFLRGDSTEGSDINGSGDAFGSSVALNADGTVLIVGSSLERSASTGINGDTTDNTASWAGAAFTFRYDETSWNQTAYLKALDSDIDDFFGDNIAVSGDGSTFIVGVNYDDSSATGINGDASTDVESSSGAVYMY